MAEGTNDHDPVLVVVDLLRCDLSPGFVAVLVRVVDDCVDRDLTHLTGQSAGVEGLLVLLRDVLGILDFLLDDRRSRHWQGNRGRVLVL